MPILKYSTITTVVPFILPLHLYCVVLFVAAVGFEGFEPGLWLNGSAPVLLRLCGSAPVLLRLTSPADSSPTLGPACPSAWMTWGGGWCLETKGKHSKTETLDNATF